MIFWKPYFTALRIIPVQQGKWLYDKPMAFLSLPGLITQSKATLWPWETLLPDKYKNAYYALA